MMGDLDFNTGRTVTIQGAGAATTIIDGNGFVTHDRVIDINSGVTVTISGVTIKNGRARIGFCQPLARRRHPQPRDAHPDRQHRQRQRERPDRPFWGGGGVTNAGNATLRNVTIQDNTTDTAGRGGGGA